MASSLTEFKLTIKSGRYDLLNLREEIKNFMLRLVAVARCAAIADFGSITFAAGAKAILQKTSVQLSSFKTNRIQIIKNNTVNYLYDTCELTILAEKDSEGSVEPLLLDLAERMLVAGGRVEKQLPLILPG